MVSRRRMIAAALALAVPVALAGCASQASPSSSSSAGGGFSGEFNVYASLAITGPLAGIAEANKEGLTAAADAINKAGGIDKKKVVLTFADDGADPSKAATLLQEQLDKSKPDFVIAGNTSSVGLAMLPTLTRQRIFSSGQLAAVNDPKTYPYHFGIVVPNTTQIQAMVDKVVASGYKKVALLHANDTNGTAVSDTYKAAFAAKGIGFQEESFSPTDVDMTAQLQRLQAGDPDVLILSGLGSVAGYELKSRTKIGWTIPTLGHSDLGTTDLAAVSSAADWKNVKVMTFSDLNPSAKRTAGFAALNSALKAAGSKLDQPFSQYAVMWDLLYVTKDVFEKAGSTDPAAVKKVYESLNITENDKSPYTFMPYYKYTADNHQLTIKPEDAMTFITPGPYVDGLPSN